MDAPIPAAGVFTTGRVGFAETFRTIYQTGYRLGIPCVHLISPYWEQALTRSIQNALKQFNPKYLLFFDGDGVWEPDDAIAMYKVIEDDDTIDAIVPCQADRNGDKPLAWAWNHEAGVLYDYSQPITPIIHGHFGLTFIRSRVFHEMPMPWLWSQPAQDGSWDRKPGKMDADTYFWVKLYREYHKGNSTGKRVVQANQTVIGHMEQHIRWQRGREVYVQTMKEWYEKGAPYGRRSPMMGEVLTPDGKPEGMPEGATVTETDAGTSMTFIPPEPQRLAGVGP